MDCAQDDCWLLTVEMGGELGEDLGSGIEEGWIGGYFWRRDMDGFCLEETGREVELSGLVV